MLARRGLARRGPRAGERLLVQAGGLCPGIDRRIVGPPWRKPHELGILPSVGGGAGVRQEDDRRFEPLAGVDGQDAHAFGLDLHVTLDLGVGGFDLGEKIVQRRRLTALMRQRQRQEFVDRVGGFGSETAGQGSPPAVLAQEQRIEREGRKGPRPLSPDRKAARRFGREEVV